MAKYEKRIRSGWVFYHENEVVFEAMDAADCKAIILSLNNYSRQLSDSTTSAVLDVSGVPSPMGQAFCKMIGERIAQDAAAYSNRCEQNAKNRNKKNTSADTDGRPQSTTVDDGRPQSTTVETGRPINKTKHKETKQSKAEEECAREALSTPTAIIPFPDADDDHDLTDQIEAHQHADDLIRRYQLPDADPTREALLEDAERAGWQALEDALKKAAVGNSRQRISVAYYRSILNPSTTKGGRYAGAADPYEGYVTL